MVAPKLELPLSKMPLSCCLDVDRLEEFRGVAFNAPLTARTARSKAATQQAALPSVLPLRRPALQQPPGVGFVSRRPKRAASASALRPEKPIDSERAANHNHRYPYTSAASSLLGLAPPLGKEAHKVIKLGHRCIFSETLCHSWHPVMDVHKPT